MKTKTLAGVTLGALAVATSVVMGCAGDRPLRNGVPNENLFLRKSFIIRPGTGGTPDKPAEDDGWILKATVLQTSTPNPLAESVLWTGAENNGMFVRFVATQDKLQLVNLREISDSKVVAEQGTRTEEVITAWDASHGDLKLAVTPDGEKTNRFEENTELDWKVRQWIKVNLAKDNLSDLALFGMQTWYRLGECANTVAASSTVEPGSILVDEDRDYLEWKVNYTVPINFKKPECVESFGAAGQNFLRLGRQNVTAVLKYSMTRAKPLQQVTYKTMEVPEKDPIRRKYGPIIETSWARDQESGQIGARELVVRFDPEKELVWYFAKGYPEEKKYIFTSPGGIVEQTNKIFEKVGAKVRLVVKNYDQDIPDDAHEVEKTRGREYGDVRYNFIRWMSDLDIGAPFIGVAQFVPDPRTGEALSASINIADFALKEFVAQRVDAFLSTIMCHASVTEDIGGVAAEVCAGLNTDKPWGPPMVEVEAEEGGRKVKRLKTLPPTCSPGEMAEIVPKTLTETYGKSSLFAKMQEYLGEPASRYGALGPRDMITPQDADFRNAYYRLLPYYIFADPALHKFVTAPGDGGEFGPEEQLKTLARQAEFHALSGAIDRGEAPYDHTSGPDFVPLAASFLDRMQAGQLNHRDFLYKKQFMHPATTKLDDVNDVVSFVGVMERAGRRCVDGRWETKEEWLEKLVQTYHAHTVWHEFGHVLGLDHNFMASVDEPNYPHYKAPGCDPAKDSKQCDRIGMYASSVMEYAATPDRIFWANESGGNGWGPYDRGAISWLYGNEGTLTPEARAEAAKKPPEGVSGQVSPTLPWKDPEGFRADGKEIQFLYCNATHTRFTPFCRQHDFGSTPSEIIANELEAYEWQYAWRNFRKYRKVWDIHNYADIPAKEIIELRRFLPVWRSDWTDTTLRDEFGRLGILPPPGVPKQDYYEQLSRKFDEEMSGANQLVAAFHQAVIQQSTGERPFATIIDKFSGDVTQQGITLDKLYAMQGWVGLWPSDNYDPNQRGAYISSFSGNSFDAEYISVATKAVASMIGEEYYDSFPYLKSAAVVQFAKDTHSINFGGNINIRDWVGGKVFDHEQQMLDYFRSMALRRGCLEGENPCKMAELGCARGPGMSAENAANPTYPTLQTCTYDPTCRSSRAVCRINPEDTHLSDEYHEFIGPDHHRYAWVYISDRHQWVIVDRARNTATYKIVRDYNVNVIKVEEEGLPAYTYLTPIKYFLDAYRAYN